MLVRKISIYNIAASRKAFYTLFGYQIFTFFELFSKVVQFLNGYFPFVCKHKKTPLIVLGLQKGCLTYCF